MSNLRFGFGQPMPIDATHAPPPRTSRAESGVSPSANLELLEYSLDEAAQRFRAAWHALLAAEGLNISLAPEFLLASSESVGLRDRMRALVATRGSQLAGVLPFFMKNVRMHSVPMRMVCLASNLIAYHPEVPAGACTIELLNACLCNQTREWDVFCAQAVPSDGPSTDAIRRIAASQGFAMVSYPGEGSPYLAINQTWDEFLRSRSSNFRYNLKRKEKALRSGGTIVERWFTSVDDVPELLRCMHDVESSSWKSTVDIAVTSKRTELDYYQTVVPFLARNGLLFANAIYLGDEPIAYHLCYRFSGVVGNMKTSFKESHSALSPGAMVIKSAIQRSFEQGAREFDFLGDAQYHKLLWTDSVRKHDVHFLFSHSLRGRLVGGMKGALKRWRRTDRHNIIRRADVTAKKT